MAAFLDAGIKKLPLVIAIYDADIAPAQVSVSTDVDIELYDPVPVDIKSALINAISNTVSQRVDEYIDKDRFLKTLLNFGSDTQRLVTNWRRDPINQDKLLLKLLSPLDFNLDIGNRAFVSREIANTIVDTIKFEVIPQPDTSLWLRPKNTEVKSFITDTELLNIYTRKVSNQTLATIGINITGSADDFGGYSFEDNILRKWYTDDYRSVELNLDFRDYANFVAYGSAELRLQAFRQKLNKLQTLITSFPDIPTPIPSASIYLQEATKVNALEKENIIRGFDPYERFLYYGSGSVYSASAYYVLNGTEYNSTGSWPRDASGSLYHTTSSVALNWYEIQSGIAKRYDDNNVNLLSNAIPTYIIDDPNSQDFIKFTNLIGHFFDDIKVYIDRLPDIYDRKVNATEGLSQDLVWNVAKSLGITLTNPDSAASLYNFTTDTSLVKKRENVTELFKRFLHNAPYLNRTRGTAVALKALLRIFGLNEQVVGIRETNTTTTGSYEIFDEVTNALNFNSGSYLVLPLSSSLRDVHTIQFRFNNSTKYTTTLGVGLGQPISGSWAVRLQTSSFADSPYGRIEVIDNGGTIVLSSSYADMFDDEDYYDVMLRYDNTSVNLQVAHSDGEEITYSSSMSTTTGSIVDAWPHTQTLFLGGSGSLSTNNFEGYIDEVRVWGEQISDSVFKTQVLDPGSFVGNDYTSPVEKLWIRLSFHVPKNASIGTLPNDSPYRNKDGVSDPFSPLLGNITNIQAVGFENKTTYPYSMTRVTRKVKQYTTNNGAYSYGSNNIIIAPPPVFTEVATDGGIVLHKDRSIVNNETRRQQQQTKNYLGFFVSPTDAVNNLLIRALGNVDVKSRVGYGTRYKNKYSDIEALQNYYKQYYNTTVNIPQFVRFFDQLVPSLFEQARQLIPAKTVLQSGIVIEPNILEHKKLTFEKPVKLSGAGTRRNNKFANTERTYNRDFDITVSTNTTLDIKARYSQSGMYQNYESTINFLEFIQPSGDSQNTFTTELTSSLITPSGDYQMYNAVPIAASSSMPVGDILPGLLKGTTIETISHDAIGGEYSVYTGKSVTPYNSESVKSQYVVYDSDVDKISYIKYLHDYAGLTYKQAAKQAITYKPGNIINVTDLIGINDNIDDINLINEILPRSDFNDYGVTNYFIKNSGIYNFETAQKEIIGRNQLNFLTGTAATWSFGQTYSRNDVVVQYGATVGSAKYYNGKLFRYIAPDAPSVSYNYPSIDQNKWAPVFYRGRAVQTPYRMIFDTNRISGDAPISTAPVTRVLISRPILQPDRYSTNLVLSNVPAYSRQIGFIRLQSIASLFSINAAVNQALSPRIRIRLYSTQTSRDNDLNRVFGVEPLGSHGVLLDMEFDSTSVSTDVGLYPAVTLVNNELLAPDNPNPIIYYTIDELGGNTYGNGFITTFNYFAIEAPIQLPIGYLPRHYRFYRDNLLATKRRNYVGCLQTQETTTDGRSPVEVTFTAGTTITVSPNILQNEENLGGINLNVN